VHTVSCAGLLPFPSCYRTRLLFGSIACLSLFSKSELRLEPNVLSTLWRYYPVFQRSIHEGNPVLAQTGAFLQPCQR
jgi:hypothetical protein